MTVHIPITLRHQGGRKQVVTPARDTMDSNPIPHRQQHVKAIVRPIAGGHAGVRSLRHVRDLAKAEAINESYVAASCVSRALANHRRSHSRRPTTENAPARRPSEAIPIEWDKQVTMLTDRRSGRATASSIPVSAMISAGSGGSFRSR